jgi:hypothetical protein
MAAHVWSQSLRMYASHCCINARRRRAYCPRLWTFRASRP